MGDGNGAGDALSALDAIFNPGAARAREELKGQNQRVVPVPSPGEKLMKDGKVTVRIPGKTTESTAKSSENEDESNPV
jgi:hypothetical protein